MGFQAVFDILILFLIVWSFFKFIPLLWNDKNKEKSNLEKKKEILEKSKKNLTEIKKEIEITEELNKIKIEETENIHHLDKVDYESTICNKKEM